MNSNVTTAREQGFLTTYFGRRRYFPDINAKNFTVRSYAERAAMNMPLQGASADIIKIAMINVDKRLKAEGLKSKLILQIHDELIVDAYKSEQEQVKRILVEEMEGAANLPVKLTVETEVGKNWFEAK
jgi:DNA polymerase-1